MFNYTKLVKRPKQSLSITGLTVSQFDTLYNEIKKNYKTIEQKRLSKNRQRDIDAGHKFDHSIKDGILMMYYQMYTTYDMLGMIFDLDKSNVIRNIKYLEPTVRRPNSIQTLCRFKKD